MAPPPSVFVTICDDLPSVGGLLAAAMPNVKALMVDGGITSSQYTCASPRCGPNRWSFFMGRFPHHHTVHANDYAGAGGAVNMDSTLVTALEALGYRCGLFGKFNNGYAGMSASVRADMRLVPPGWWVGHNPFFPERSGWQAFKSNGEYIGTATKPYEILIGQGDRSVASQFRDDDDLGLGNPNTDYSADLFGYRAIQFINDPDNAGEPLFVYYAPKATHEPLEPAARHTTGCNIGVWDPHSWNEGCVGAFDPDDSEKPLWVRNLDCLPAGSQRNLRNHCLCLQAVDENWKAIRDALIASGRTDLITLYLSDNGYVLGEHKIGTGKNVLYRPSRIIPLYVHWPGNMGGAGARTLADPISTIDLPVTILDAAGGSMSHSTPDAVSHKARIQSTGGSPARTEVPSESLTRVDEVAPWFGFQYATSHNFYGKLFHGSAVNPPVAPEEEWYLGSDPDELVNKIADGGQAANVAAARARYAQLVGTLPSRPYLEGIAGFAGSNTSDTTIRIPLDLVCPAGFHVVVAAASSSSLGLHVELTDSLGTNVYQTDVEASDGQFAMWLASMRVDHQLGLAHELLLSITDDFGSPVSVGERRAVAMLVRNLKTDGWYDQASVIAQANSQYPKTSSLVPSARDAFLVSMVTSAGAGGNVKEGPGFTLGYNSNEAEFGGLSGRRFGVHYQEVFDPFPFVFATELSTGPTSWRTIMGAYLKEPADDPPPPGGITGGKKFLVLTRTSG